MIGSVAPIRAAFAFKVKGFKCHIILNPDDCPCHQFGEYIGLEFANDQQFSRLNNIMLLNERRNNFIDGLRPHYTTAAPFTQQSTPSLVELLQYLPDQWCLFVYITPPHFSYVVTPPVNFVKVIGFAPSIQIELKLIKPSGSL
jgi:hypothetical protein